MTEPLTIDSLATLFALPSWDSIDELNQEYYWESAKGAREAYLENLHWQDDPDETYQETQEDLDAADEAQEKAEQEVRDELFATWYDAILSAAECTFANYHLAIVPRSIKAYRKNSRVYELKIVLADCIGCWIHPALAVNELLRGIDGGYGYGTLGECMRIASVNTARQFVFAHLHLIPKYHAEVYDATSPQRLYEGAFR